MIDYTEIGHSEQLCTLEGCSNQVGDGLLVFQEGVLVGAVCEECLGSAKGVKLFLRREDGDSEFGLEEMHRIENPI